MSARVTVPAKRQLATKFKLDPSSSINGFNFSFASMLLAKLNKLIKEDEFFSGPPCDQGGHEGMTLYLKPIAKVVLYHLTTQIPCIYFERGTNYITEKGVNELVSAATEFLAIFEGKLK